MSTLFALIGALLICAQPLPSYEGASDTTQSVARGAGLV